MNPIRRIIQAEIENSREVERSKSRRKRSSKKKRAAGIGAGAAGGALMGGLAGHEISKYAARAVSSRVTPQSSSVRGFSYDPKSKSMLITFKNGGTYRYKGVPPNVAKSMGRNKSVGKTVHRRIKKGGYQYEKVAKKKKQKNYKCKFCKDPATKGVIWAEGRGIVPCCDKHLSKGKVSIDDPKDIDLIRDLTKTATGDLVNSHENSIAVAAKKTGNSPSTIAFIRSRNGNPNSPTSKYYAKKRRDKRMAKTAEERVMMPVEPYELLPDETPISERVFENLTLQAKTLPEEAIASQAELVMDKMASVRRQTAKLAGACKKQLTWHGLTMKLEYLHGGERSGVNKQGVKWSRTMKGSYGYMPGTYGRGADGEAIDVYFSPKASAEESGSVYRIRQLRKDDGKFDEDKFMVGYVSSADAKKGFLSNMPKWAFGDIIEMSMASFKTIVGQGIKKVAGLMDDLKEKGSAIADKAKTHVRKEMTDMRSGSPSGDKKTFIFGNEAAKVYGKAYGRGAMRAVGLDPSNEVHVRGAQGAGVAAVALPFVKMRSSHKNGKAEDARLKDLEAQLAKAKGKNKSKIVAAISRALRRGK